MSLFGSLTRSITILMVYMHQYSYINLSILSILYYFYIGIGLQIIFQYSSMFQEDNFYQASKQYLAGLVVFQMTNYQDSNKTFLLQVIPIITLGTLYTVLNFIKYFSPHPASIISRVVITIAEVITYIILFILSPAFMMNIFDYVLQIIENETSSIPDKFINVILSILNILLTQFFMWKYSVCYQEFSYNKLYMLHSEVYFTLQIVYIVFSSALRYSFYTEVIALQIYTIIFNVVIVFCISMKRIFSFTYQSLYIYFLVVFSSFLCIMNAMLAIFDYIDPDIANSDLLFVLGAISSTVAAVLCTLIQRQIFRINIIQNLPFVKTSFHENNQNILIRTFKKCFNSIETYGKQMINKMNKTMCKIQKRKLKNQKPKKEKKGVPTQKQKQPESATKKHGMRTKIHYGISKDFLFNLLAYYGPEFCGVVNDPEHDYMLQCEYKQLTQAEYQLLLPRIKHAEDCMEKFKLLYENIFANIYYTYAMSGQTMQVLTLLDIEAALPVPQLVTYLAHWKTAEDAFTTIVYMMKQLQSINEMLGIDDMKYQFANQLFKKVKQSFNKNIQNVLLQQGVKLPDNITLSQFSDVNNGKVSDFSENEYNIWNNHYAKQQSNPVHGGLYLVSQKDFQQQKYLFKHYDTCINDQSLIFVYVPSFTSHSTITGNLHRLCWNNDNSNLRTIKQRTNHIIALISLARIIFPSKQRLYGQYKYPFVNQWKFTSLSKFRDIQRINTNIKVSYMKQFTINITRPKYQIRSNKILYQLAPVILPTIQSEHVHSPALQYFLTEVFVMKLVEFGQCNQKTKIFLDTIHNQHLSPFQQLQLMKIPETLDNTQLKQILQNQNYNMDHRIVQNAIAVLFGSGSLDYYQVSNIKTVVDTLQRNQYYYDHQYRSYFYGYTQYMYLKVKLYMQNFICPMDKLTEMEAFLSDLLAYQDQFINILKVHNQEESIVNVQIFKFLSKYYEHIVKLIPLQCTHELESDQLQLLHAIYRDESVNYQQQTNTDFHRQYNYTDMITMYNQLHDQPKLRQYFSMYTTTKLSNLVYTIENSLMYNYIHDREEQFQNPYKYNQVIDSAQIGLRIILTFLSTHKIQFKEQEEKSITSKSSNSSFSMSSFSSTSESTTDDESEIAQHHNLFKQGFNIQFWDLDFISHDDIFFFAKGKDETLLMQNYEASHNTPEFVLAILNYDNERLHTEYNTFFTLVVIDLFKQLHNIKINDNSFRSLSTASYLIQSIQQKEYYIEQQIIYFLRNLIEVKKSEFNIKDTSIPQLINSLNEINAEITKLLQIYLSLLHREYLTEDHIYIIKKEMDRSIKMLYGYPDINYDSFPTDKDKLIAICEIYLGYQQSMIPVVLNQIEKLPRSGGIYHSNLSYVFDRHRTWGYKFMWENPDAQKTQQGEEEDKQVDSTVHTPLPARVSIPLRSLQMETQQLQHKSSKLSLQLPMQSTDQQEEITEDSLSISLNIHGSPSENDNILPSSHTQSDDSSKTSKMSHRMLKKLKNGIKFIRKYFIIPMLVSLIITLFLGLIIMTLIMQQMQIFKSKLQVIEQTTSEALYELGYISNEVQLILEEKPTYIIKEYFFNQKLASYQLLNDKLFKNYLVLTSYFTGKNIKTIYNEELQKQQFKYDLELLQTDVLPACNISTYFNIKNKKGRQGFKFLLSELVPEEDSKFLYNYYFVNPVRINLLDTRFNYTFNTTVTDVTIMETLYIYTMTMNCQSNVLMNAMYLQNSSQNISSISRDIQRLQLQYENVFNIAFAALRNNYYITIKYYSHIVIYIFTVLILLQMYLIIHHILINYQTKILIDNIDKGSTISRISKLPISKLEQLLRQYRQKISQNHKYNAQAQNAYNSAHHNIQHQQFQHHLNKVIENQKIDEQFNKFWDVATRMFKHVVHNILLAPIFISAILFIIGYALITKSIISPIMASSINIQNEFTSASYQFPNQVPYIDQYYNRTNLESFKFASYLTEANSTSHPPFAAVNFTLEWIKYFNENELSVNNLEFFVMVPFPQVDYLRLYMQITPTYASEDEQYEMLQILNQLGRAVVQVINHQSQNIINNVQLAETYEKIMNLYNIKQYNQTFGQYYQENEIINIVDKYLRKSTIHYSVYIGITLYVMYLIIQIACLITLLRNVFVYMYRPYNINFNKKNKQVRVISQLLQNRFTFMFLMFIMLINFITITLEIFNAYNLLNFVYLSVDQFNKGVSNFGLLVYQRITPLEFTINLFCLLIMLTLYDTYAYNLLVTVCSLGKDKNVTFIPPYHIERRKTQINFQVLKVLTAIASIGTICFIQFQAYMVPSVLNMTNFYLSQTISNLNQLGIIMQPTYNFQPNIFYTHYQNMFKTVDMGIQLLEQTGNVNTIIDVVNVQESQDTLINDYIDTLWKLTIGSLNKAVLKYYDQMPPSFIYGAINNSQFERYYLPRTQKFGQQLAAIGDLQCSQPLLTLLLMYTTCAKVTTYYPNRELYQELMSDFQAYQNVHMSLAGRSDQQRTVSYMVYVSNQYIPQISKRLNRYAEGLLLDQLKSSISGLYACFTVSICVIAVFLAVIILVLLRTTFLARRFLLQNNLFTSLFLKRHFLLSTHGFSSRSSMSSKAQTDFNTKNPTTPRQLMFNDISICQVHSSNDHSD